MEKVVGVRRFLFLPRLMVCFTSAEEFHSVKKTRYFAPTSHCWRSRSWADFPDPPIPSTVMSRPGNGWSDESFIFMTFSSSLSFQSPEDATGRGARRVSRRVLPPKGYRDRSCTALPF